jgi:hypothetical protein
MRNSRSSLPRLIALAIPLWALSACFSAPEPPAVFAPPEDASVTNEPNDSEDTGSTAVGDVSETAEDDTETAEDVTETAEDVTETSEDVTETSEDVTETSEDVTETSEDVTETGEDVTETGEDVTETGDTTDIAPEPVETCPAGGDGTPKPANTCVDWTCSSGAWKDKESVDSTEGDTCDSPCYPSSGELTCQDGECRPALGGDDDCPDATPDNPCFVTLCDHVIGICDIEATAPFTSCDDDDACTEDDQCEGDGTCTGTPKSCSEDDGHDCTSGGNCNPESGACEPTIAEGFCLLPPVGEEGPKACYGQDARAPGNTCFSCSVSDSQTSWSTLGNGMPCDDGDPNPCKVGTCVEESDEMSTCVSGNAPPGTLCDDDDLTTNADQCDGEGSCAGTPMNCPESECSVNNPDGSNCNPQPLASGTACAESLPCIDGLCDGTGQCEGGVLDGWCQVDGKCIGEGNSPGDDPCVVCGADAPTLEDKCDDGDPCTADSCDPETGDCTYEPITSNGEFEICDGLDNNCDGETDEGFKTNSCSPDVMGETCPGLGAPKADNPCLICTAEAGEGTDAGWALADNGTECDDGDGNSCTTGACTTGLCGAGPDVDSVGCSCCVSNAEVTPGCNDNDIEDSVCALDPHCCETNWDDACAQLASEQGACGPTVCDDELANMDEVWGDLECETPDYDQDDCNHDSDCSSALDQPQTETCGIAVCSKVWERACDGDDDVDCGAGSPFSGQCTHLPAEVVGQTPGTCDDGYACNGVEDPCVMGVCPPPPEDESVGCDDQDVCTTDSCDPETGECVYTSDVDCDDQSDCTTDSCDSALGCQYEDINCDDGIECTDDSCDLDEGCLHEAVDSYCDDEIECTTDSCDDGDGGGGCLHEANDSYCDDEIECTVDSCDDSDGCVHDALDTLCGDNIDCTQEICHPTNGCTYVPHDSACDDSVACTDDSCDPDSGCVFSTIVGCADLECTADSDCDYVGCLGSCATGNVTGNVCQYPNDSMCSLECSGPTASEPVFKTDLDPSEVEYPPYLGGGFVIHAGVAYIVKAVDPSELADPEQEIDEDESAFEVSRYDISDNASEPDEWSSWRGADFGFTAGSLGGPDNEMMGGISPEIQGRGNWLDVSISTGSEATLCSVDLSDGEQSDPTPDDCGLWDATDAAEITALGKTPLFVLAGAATHHAPYNDLTCTWECEDDEVCVDGGCQSAEIGPRNYLVSLKLGSDGEIMGDELSRVTSVEVLNALDGPSSEDYVFSPADIAVDHPEMGETTRVIVAGRLLKKLEDEWGPFYDPAGGGVLFGNLSEEGHLSIANSKVYWASQLKASVTSANTGDPLAKYEPAQIIVNRRAGQSIAYVLWGLGPYETCGGSGTTYEICEVVVTAHNLSDETLMGAQQYSSAAPLDGGRIAMTLLGSPIGSTRLAIGSGTLFAVEHGYDTTWTGFAPQAVPLAFPELPTWGVAQTDSRLMWLTQTYDEESSPGMDFWTHHPATLRQFSLQCDPVN